MPNDKIKTTIEELLRKLGVEIEAIEVIEHAPGTTVYSVRSRDSKLLIGSRGKHLSALNHIVGQIIKNKAGNEVPAFSIDVNYYRSQQIRELIESAREAAERAKLFHRDVELEPMSSYERLIVHNALSETPDITTASIGEDKFRRVVVKFNTEVRNTNSEVDFSAQTENAPTKTFA
jgi:spoIIIJ-associated protein